MSDRQSVGGRKCEMVREWGFAYNKQILLSRTFAATNISVNRSPQCFVLRVQPLVLGVLLFVAQAGLARVATLEARPTPVAEVADYQPEGTGEDDQGQQVVRGGKLVPEADDEVVDGIVAAGLLVQGIPLLVDGAYERSGIYSYHKPKDGITAR